MLMLEKVEYFNWLQALMMLYQFHIKNDFTIYKLTDQVLKLLKWVLVFYIHKIAEMQFGFVPGRATTDTI